jgi:uncharacterized phiE125 gp8 family phage protein
MIPPVLIGAPSEPVVAIADLLLHLRIDGAEESALVETLGQAAEAHLDGWTGVLGRAILPQTWRQDFTGWGDLRLAQPDVASAVVTYRDADGVFQPVDAVVQSDLRGPYLCVSGPSTDLVRVEYICGLPARQLPVAQVLVKLLVGHWYANREAVVVGVNASELPMGVTALITALSWRDL